jgi:tetratricopeptide (TPR) repeat protein
VAFVAAMQVDPKSPETIENLASLYADEGRISEALTMYEKLRELDPHSPKTLSEIASLQLQSGEFEKSLDTAKSVPPASRPARLLPIMIGDYIALKRMDDVQKTVPEVLKRAPGNPEVIPQLAEIFLEGDMAGDAQQLLKLAAPRLKPTPALLTAEANVLARTGHRKQAVAILKRAIALDPNYPEALWGAAKLAGGAGDWKAANAYLKRMLKNAPPRPEVLRDLAVASMQIDDMQTAHDAAQDLEAMEHGSLDSVLVMSAVLIRGLHYGEAVELSQKALQQYPNDKRLELALGTAQFKLGKIDEAEPHLKAALGQGAADGEVHYTLGLIAKQRGDALAATAQLESALALDPKRPDVLSSLAQLYLQANEVQKARKALERAVKLAPEEPQNHYQLAITYRRLGLSAEAKEQMGLFQKFSIRKVPDAAGNRETNPR